MKNPTTTVHDAIKNGQVSEVLSNVWVSEGCTAALQAVVARAERHEIANQTQNRTGDRVLCEPRGAPRFPFVYKISLLSVRLF